MAAGASRRFGRLKQTTPVGPDGQVLLEYGLYDAIRVGFTRVVFVIRREMETEFHAVVGARIVGLADVSYVYQESPQERMKPWGTGHAILSAADSLSEPFGVVNADDFYGRRSFEILASALRGDDCLLVGFQLNHTLSEHGAVTRGICRTDASGRLVDLAETFDIERHGADIRSSTGSLSGRELVSMNMWGFQPGVIDLLRREWSDFRASNRCSREAEFYISAAVTTLIESDDLRVDVTPTPETWFGITNPGDERSVASALERLTAERVYPSALWP